MNRSIFFDFTLPNSASWFYFALFLAVALFFQFSRPVSLRNWDLLALFLFAPGFLLIQEANQSAAAGAPRPERERFAGYAWLLAASAYWMVRCLLDAASRKRPLPAPNLAAPAMAWFGCSLFACLAAVAFTRPADPWEQVGKRPPAIVGIERGAAEVMRPAPDGGAPTAEALFWVRRALAATLQLLVVVALVLVGGKHFGDWGTGAAAGTLYLLLPYTAYHVGQVHHVWPAALVLWAVVAFRRPTLAGALVGLAAGTSFFPVLLLPAWTQFYRRRGAGRFLLASLLVGSLALGATLLFGALAGGPGLPLDDWQPWRMPTADSVWTGAHWAYRMPVFVAFAAFVVGTVAWPPARDVGQLLAASAAVLIGVQFWYADRGGLYVLWYAPLLVLLVLRPTTADLQPGPAAAWKGWGRRRRREPALT